LTLAGATITISRIFAVERRGMRRGWVLAAIWIAWVAVLPACSNRLFDDLDVYSCREHLFDRGKGGDMLQAMDKTGIKRVVLVGALNSTFAPKEPTDWASAEHNNQLLLDSVEQAGGRVIIFPLIRGDEPDVLGVVKAFYAKGARGFVLTHGLPHQRLMPLTDPRLRPLYAWCEFNHVPVLIDVDFAKHGDEFEAVLREYPGLTVIGGRLVSLVDDLPRLRTLLLRYYNLYVDLSFGWDEDRRHAFETLTAQRETFLPLLKKHADRFLWGTQIVVARAGGRNVDWLTQYMIDARYFLERRTVKAKFLIRDKPALVTLPGLDLSKQELSQFYNLNLKRIIDDRLPVDTPTDLDQLVVAPPPGAVYDKEGDHRLLIACVTGAANPIEGIFSARLKNALTGVLTNWREINGLDAPLDVVTVPPLDAWLAPTLSLEKIARLTVVPDVAAVKQRLAAQPLTLALLPFGSLEPGMRVVAVDGESPATPYTRDVARRGGPLIKNYFRNYPLLTPLKFDGAAPPGLVFRPHELRRVMFAAELLPSGIAPTPPSDEGLDSFGDTLFRIAAWLQSADWSGFVLDRPFGVNCLVPQARCLDGRWLNALDYAGLDGAVPAPTGEPGWPETRQALRAHGIATPTGDATEILEFELRSMRFTVLSDNTLAPGWRDRLIRAVSEAVGRNARTFVFLRVGASAAATGNEARALIDAGAEAVVLINAAEPHLADNRQGRPRVFSLGAPAVAPDRPAFLCLHTYYQDRLISVDFWPVVFAGGKIDALHANDLPRAYATLFGQPVK
jgi:hypothetical protein